MIVFIKTHFKKMCKSRIISGCHTALHLKSSRTSHFSVQKIRWCLKLPSAPSSFSFKVLAAARCVARTRQSVRLCSQCGQSDSTALELLCQHAGHRMTGCRVRATDWAAVRTSCENVHGADLIFKRPKERTPDFLLTEVTCAKKNQMQSCIA